MQKGRAALCPSSVCAVCDISQVLFFSYYSNQIYCIHDSEIIYMLSYFLFGLNLKCINIVKLYLFYFIHFKKIVQVNKKFYMFKVPIRLKACRVKGSPHLPNHFTPTKNHRLPLECVQKYVQTFSGLCGRRSVDLTPQKSK